MTKTTSRVYRCNCGTWAGEPCQWTGPLSQMVVVEWMPEYIRASHAAARNKGEYPYNGSVRVAVERSCAERLFEPGEAEDSWDESEWAEILDVDPAEYAGEPVMVVAEVHNSYSLGDVTDYHLVELTDGRWAFAWGGELTLHDRDEIDAGLLQATAEEGAQVFDGCEAAEAAWRACAKALMVTDWRGGIEMLERLGDEAVADFVVEHVGPDAVASYLTADGGCKLGLYADGKVLVGQDVGSEIDPDELPVAVVECPGIGNVDMAAYREGWDCGHLSDAEVIRDRCVNGDISDELTDLIGRLVADARG